MSFFRQKVKGQRHDFQSSVQAFKAGRLFLKDKPAKPWPRPFLLDSRLFSMSTRQIHQCLGNQNTVSCLACGLTVYSVPATVPDLLSKPSIGFWTKRKDLGNNAIDRTRGRKRVREIAAAACIQCGLPGVQYIFRLSGPILFLSPKDIYSEIHYAMNVLADKQLARRPLPKSLPGCLTINELRKRISDFDSIMGSMAGQYATCLYSGSKWDGTYHSIVSQLQNLCNLAKSDPIVKKALSMRSAGDFRGTHHVKKHCRKCQFQSHLIRYFIGYCFPRGHLQYIPDIVPILSRLLSV